MTRMSVFSICLALLGGLLSGIAMADDDADSTDAPAASAQSDETSESTKESDSTTSEPAADFEESSDESGLPAELESLAQIALANSPSVQQTLADVQKAKGLRFQSTRSPNPVAGYSASEIGNEGHAGQQGAFWSQTFRRAEKLDLNARIGDWDVQAATWAWQIEQQRVAGTVQVRWYSAAAAWQRIRLLNKLRSVLENAVETTKALLDAGETSRTPYLQAQLELRRNTLLIRNAESALDSARRQLAAVAATSVDALPEEFPGLGWSIGFTDEQSYVVQLLATSPELHLARARIAQHQANVCRQQVEPKTDLQTQLTLQYDDSTNDTVSGVQIGFTLPLFDRNRGNISAASADYLRACQEVRRKELELTRLAAAIYRDYVVANREVETIDSDLLPLAQENLEVTAKSFKLGEAEYQSLLTTQRSYVELILTRIDALRRVRQAEAKLDAWLLAEDISE